MGTIYFDKMIVRGKTESLEDFVRCFEHNYDHNKLYLESFFIDNNSFQIEGPDSPSLFRIVDFYELIEKYTSLKFEYYLPGDGWDDSFKIYLNGDIILDCVCDFDRIGDSNTNYLTKEDDFYYEVRYKDPVCELIIEKDDFPQSIPLNAHEYDLKVINQDQETLAFLYRIGFLMGSIRYSSSDEFFACYDQIYEDYQNWDNAGLSIDDQTPEEQIEDFNHYVEDLRWSPCTLVQIRETDFPIKLMGLCRLAYPYQCDVKKLTDILSHLKGEVYVEDILSLNDIQVLRKAIELGWIDIVDALPHLIEKRWIYDHPSYWFSKENIDDCIDFVNKNKITEVTSFLLDYKNKNIGFTKELTRVEGLPITSNFWDTTQNLDGSLTITKYKGNDTSLIFPAVIANKQVKQIGSHEQFPKDILFRFVEFESVIISEGIEVIGPHVFNFCYLKSIILPPGLRMIHAGAFRECYLPKAVSIPSGVKDIRIASFMGCSGLEYIRLPQTLLQIGEAAFASCPSLSSVIIPENVKWIEKEAFQNCERLQYVAFSDNIEYIAKDAFVGCDLLNILGNTHSYVHQFARENNISFIERKLVYGKTSMGLIFFTDSRAQELADGYRALAKAKTWGEFRRRVSKEIYEFSLTKSKHYQGPVNPEGDDLTRYYVADETPFMPTDVFTYDRPLSQPALEMATWIPKDIQEKYGRRFSYTAMDVNVPAGEALELDVCKHDDILMALESYGFELKRDEALILMALGTSFDLDAYQDVEE